MARLPVLMVASSPLVLVSTRALSTRRVSVPVDVPPEEELSELEPVLVLLTR